RGPPRAAPPPPRGVDGQAAGAGSSLGPGARGKENHTHRLNPRRRGQLLLIRSRRCDWPVRLLSPRGQPSASRCRQQRVRATAIDLHQLLTLPGSEVTRIVPELTNLACQNGLLRRWTIVFHTASFPLRGSEIPRSPPARSS